MTAPDPFTWWPAFALAIAIGAYGLHLLATAPQ